MKSHYFSTQLTQLLPRFRPVVAPFVLPSSYVPIDLSTTSKAIQSLDLTNAAAMEKYIQHYCQEQGAVIAYGGYLEKRNLYKRSLHFNQEDPDTERNIHLGVDFWAAAGTAVTAPLAGKVYSFRDNKGVGDYGPTIILEHELEGGTFYTLYGHLSRAYLQGWKQGQKVEAGQVIAELGAAAVNGDYAPHLHFQIILDLQGKQGDYPGVCSQKDLAFYQNNCPDPKLLLQLP